MVQKCHFHNIIIVLYYFLVILFLVFASPHKNKCKVRRPRTIDDHDIDIDPYNFKEEGCPLVVERYNLKIGKLSGNWRLPFVSMNWLADLGIFLNKQKRGPISLKFITSVCINIKISHAPHQLIFNITSPQLKGKVNISCEVQHHRTRSKFTCFDENDIRDEYIMVSATDHANWIILVRCVPGEADPEIPSKGMSWAILSKKKRLDRNISNVLFSVLRGYGFDVDTFKAVLPYKNCTKRSN